MPGRYVSSWLKGNVGCDSRLTGKAAEVVNSSDIGEAVLATQARAGAGRAVAALAVTLGDGSLSGTGGESDGALDCGCGSGGDTSRRQGGAVLLDSELLVVRERLVAALDGVDAEDHALAAVRAVLLLAVGPLNRLEVVLCTSSC